MHDGARRWLVSAVPKRWEPVAARLAHAVLYVLMFMASVTGWMVATTFRVARMIFNHNPQLPVFADRQLDCARNRRKRVLFEVRNYNCGATSGAPENERPVFAPVSPALWPRHMVGYAFQGENGRSYTSNWALSRAEEKAAFEWFVDFVIERLEEFPDLHIYHFAPYEPAALKRLMGRYATRENEIDPMLRAGLFVDLYAVVRHSIRASVESYSIKKLEPLYGFARAVPLPDANEALINVQACLELDDLENIKDEARIIVQGYNRDDCLSTWELRDWLEALRSELINAGTVITQPLPKTGEASEDLSDWQKKTAALIHRLTHDVPVDVAERTTEQHARLASRVHTRLAS